MPASDQIPFSVRKPAPAGIFLTAPVRTPMGKFGGALASLSAVDLGVISAKETIRRAGIPVESIEESIFGNARPAGVGPNPGRQIAHGAGLPFSTPGYTINKACASGMKAVTNGAQSIACGDTDVIMAGGAESMSNAPYLLMKARWGLRFGNDQLVDSMIRDGYLCPLCGQMMGSTAETLAEKYGISREAQDVYAAKTQQRCEAARKAGRFDDEIVPVEIKDKKGRVSAVASDEHPRDGVTPESLAKLQPAFKTDGTVHAGNASGIVDGAASLLVVSERFVKASKVEPMARIVDYTVAGVDPALMGIGPVPAVLCLLERNRLKLDEIDLVELNEAFAVQVLACQKELGLDLDRVNVNGGAIALGHPSGCTGTRIIVTLLHEMKRRGSRLGLATLCVSGGMGMALLVERV